MAITSATKNPRGANGRQRSLPFPGTAGGLAGVQHSAVIAAALADVGPRLKRVRTQRDITLTELAAATGISKSTLSRLESGQRKPSLELLLLIAKAHRIPLEELIDAPEVGDPRVRFTPRRRNGRIVVPLTRNPGGLQAWKTITPPSPVSRSCAPTRATSGCTCWPDGCG